MVASDASTTDDERTPAGTSVPAWPLAGVTLAGLWLFVRGVDLAVEVIVGQFLFGLAVGVPVAIVFRRLYTDRVNLRRGVHAVPYALLYLLTFGTELVRANVDVACRVLAIDPPIEPEVILVPLRVRSAVGITLIANSITLTPGTVALDHDPETNALYVHAFDGRDPEAIVAPIRTWEEYALEIFDEELSPAASAPDPIVDGPPATDVSSGGAPDDGSVDASDDTRTSGDDDE